MKKLTKKSRWMVYLSFFISGVAIFSTVFYFIMVKDNSNPQTVLVPIVIVIIAVLAIMSMIISRKKLIKNTSNLSPEFFEVYEEISDKLNGVAMSNFEKKETMSDILDLFLLAAKDSRNVSDVVGNDIDEFVNQIQNSFGYRSKLIFCFLTGIQYIILYLFMMQISQIIKYPEKNFFNQEISISIALFLIPLAFAGIPLMTHFIKKNKLTWVIIIPICILGFFIAAMEVMNKFFINIPLVYTLVEGDVNVIPNFLDTVNMDWNICTNNNFKMDAKKNLNK